MWGYRDPGSGGVLVGASTYYYGSGKAREQSGLLEMHLEDGLEP